MTDGSAPRHILVIADGAVPGIESLDASWPGWSADVDRVIAADGGARHAAALGQRLDLWVGDGDSLGEPGVAALRDQGVEIRRLAVDKDETDTEVALLAAAGTGTERITVLGALGGARVDHALANVWLLGHPGLVDVHVRILDEAASIRLIGPGTTPLRGRIGDLVSLLPFAGGAAGITTSGLGYPLADEPLLIGPARGLSNVRLSESAAITVRSGRILVVETPVRLTR
jgi:thiamine pyrophosphokinase